MSTNKKETAIEVPTQADISVILSWLSLPEIPCATAWRPSRDRIVEMGASVGLRESERLARCRLRGGS